MLVIPFLPKISFGSCTNSSNLNHSPAAVRACCDASWHLWVWRGSIPFTLQSYSQQELCCRGLGMGELCQSLLSSMSLPVLRDVLGKS